MASSRKRSFAFIVFLVLAACVAIGGIYGWHYYQGAQTAVAAATSTVSQFKTPEESDIYVRFDMEVYDIIVANYWQKPTDSDMATLYRLALQKVTNAPMPPDLPSPDRAGVAKMLAAALVQASSTEEKRQLSETEATAVLYNLAPAGRSSLLSQQQETALRQEVSNVHPNDNLYQDLGVSQGATKQEVDQAYQQTQAALKNATSSEDKQKLAQAEYAHTVLSDTANKAQYDAAKIEPTIFGRVIGKALYVNMTQVSPTSLQEFALAIDHASTTPGLDSLIVDLRGNIGGALDFTQAFLGLFIGMNQYAFDLYHQGDLDVQRTTQGKFDELGRYTNVAFLVDNMTQSTAELTSAAFKKFRLARIVGASPTRGWGTVENTIPVTTSIDPAQKFSVLLVEYITLREDNQPIQDHGVDPDINTSQKGWQSQLPKYFSSPNMISALKQVADKPPIK